MKNLIYLLLIFFFCSTIYGDRFVALDGGNQSPYDTWAKAATSIQAGIDAAGFGETVFVSNGAYASGITYLFGSSNRIAITKPVEVRSVSGPEFTFIHGSGSLGVDPVRCALLTNGAKLVGFTLSFGNTEKDSNNYLIDSGGGALLLYDGTIENCRIMYCKAGKGGGAFSYFGGTIENCSFLFNVAEMHGGGAFFWGGGNIRNSSLCFNSADQYAGGLGVKLFNNTVDNCVIYNNSSVFGGGGIVAQNGSGILKNCEILNNSTKGSGGGIQLIDGDFTLSNSKIYDNSAIGGYGGGICSYFNGFSFNRIINCTVTHNTATNGGGIYVDGGCTSINSIISFNTALADGNNWSTNGPMNSFGNCYTTPNPGGAGNIIGINPEFANSSQRNYHLRDISVCRNSGNNSPIVNSSDFEGNPRIIETTVDMGCYEFVPESPGTPEHYVSTAGGNSYPYTNWTMAANNIQSAINATEDGDTVIVRDGVYNKGFGEIRGLGRSRVMLKKNIVLESESGKENTIIAGALPAFYSGVRCAYLTNNAIIINLTLSNGVAESSGGGAYFDNGGTISDCNIKNCYSELGAGAYIRQKGEIRNSSVFNNACKIYGGGVYCIYGGIVTNCDVFNNYGAGAGGGVYCLGSGLVTDSRIFDNIGKFDTGGVGCHTSGIVDNCEIFGNYSKSAGGAGCWYGGIVRNSIIRDNSADTAAGGQCFKGGQFENCLIFNNNATNVCGGIRIYGWPGDEIGVVRNCTIVNNFAENYAGGIEMLSSGIVQNTIVYLNSAINSGDNWYTNDTGAIIEYSCFFPEFAGAGNITNYPDFDDPGSGDFHLPGFSPCVDAGTNAFAAIPVDLDGNSRIHDGIVDMGCFEFIPEPGKFIYFILFFLFGKNKINKFITCLM